MNYSISIKFRSVLEEIIMNILNNAIDAVEKNDSGESFISIKTNSAHFPLRLAN